MATPNNKDTQLEKTKGSIKKDIQRVTTAADYLTGVQTPDGRVFQKQKNKTQQKPVTTDIDDFLRVVEQGFINQTPEKDDIPYGGALGNIKITRLTQGTGKTTK